MLHANEINGFIQTVSIHKLDLGKKKKKPTKLIFTSFFLLFVNLKKHILFFCNLNILQNLKKKTQKTVECKSQGEGFPEKLRTPHPWKSSRPGLGATWNCGRCPFPWQQQDDFKASSNPNHTMIL